jgi:hypothetical protein
VTVRATQPGDANFTAARDVEATLWAIEARLSPLQVGPSRGNGWELAVEAMPGVSVVIEHSFSLTNWTVVSRSNLLEGRMSIELPPTNSWEFYRAKVELPPP